MVRFHYLCLLCLLFGCRQESTKPIGINSCYILRPVLNSSSEYEPKGFDFSNKNKLIESLDYNEYPNIDTLMEFVTGFSFQKEISVSYDCFSKLTMPDSSYLMEIFYFSMENTNSLIQGVQFVGKKEIQIVNFGNATIYEYDFIDVVETSPTKLYLLFKKLKNKYKKDFKGIAFCSNGLIHTETMNGSIISMIGKIRNSKRYEIVLNYDGSKFVPIGHCKLGDW